jgi:hypothetical protein
LSGNNRIDRCATLSNFAVLSQNAMARDAGAWIAGDDPASLLRAPREIKSFTPLA